MPAIRTGIAQLDRVLVESPSGQIVTIAGNDGVGKTLIGVLACRNMSSSLYIDANAMFSRPLPHTLVVQTNDISNVSDILNVSVGKVDIIVIDTITSMVLPNASLYQTGNRAVINAWDRILRDIGARVVRSQTCILALADPFPVVWPFQRRSSIYIRVTTDGNIRRGIENVGHWVRAECRGTTIRFPLYYAA